MIDRAALRVLVWDVDDTLYLERDYVRSGFLAVGAHVDAHRGTHGFGPFLWRQFEEGVRGDSFDRALRHFGLPVEGVPELIRIYREHSPEIALLPDARAAIEGFDGRQAVITDGPRASQAAKVEALGLRACCDPVILTADLGPGKAKPAPDAFLAVQAATGAEGTALIYIADNPRKDFVSPRALGWQTLRIRRPGGLHEAVPSGPDVDTEAPDLAILG